MLLNNEFEIDCGIDEAWEFLTDLTRVMPCMPGAATHRFAPSRRNFLRARWCSRSQPPAPGSS